MSKKKLLISLGVRCGICLLLALGCLLLRGSLTRKLPGQQAAERWAGDGEESYAQYACYLGEADSLSLDGVYAFRQTLDTLREGDSTIGPYQDAWSRVDSLTVHSARESSKAVSVAVGGSYFAFHPLRLLDGSYLDPADLNPDRVLLDEQLAWYLFGSSELAGLEVTINDLPFQIAGVVAREENRGTMRYQADTPVVYLPWTAWTSLLGGAGGITCYEIVLPEPVNGYAEQLLTKSFPLGAGLMQRCTGRFDLAASWALLRDFAARGAITTAVSLPWWENAARYYENCCALLLFFLLLLLLLPALCGLALLVWGWIAARRGLRKGLPWLFRRIGDGVYTLSGKLQRRKR